MSGLNRDNHERIPRDDELLPPLPLAEGEERPLIRVRSVKYLEDIYLCEDAELTPEQQSLKEKTEANGGIVNIYRLHKTIYNAYIAGQEFRKKVNQSLALVEILLGPPPVMPTTYSFKGIRKDGVQGTFVSRTTFGRDLARKVIEATYFDVVLEEEVVGDKS